MMIFCFFCIWLSLWMRIDWIPKLWLLCNNVLLFSFLRHVFLSLSYIKILRVGVLCLRRRVHADFQIAQFCLADFWNVCVCVWGEDDRLFPPLHSTFPRRGKCFNPSWCKVGQSSNRSRFHHLTQLHLNIWTVNVFFWEIFSFNFFVRGFFN